MKLYNTLSRSTEPFTVQEEPVTVYVCGITPYDTTHLGHAFTYAAIDVLIRYLIFQGREVLYVQNVTDIDDDILKRAGEMNEDWKSLGDRWTARFIRDMRALNVRPPDHFPRATGTISEIINLAQRLLRFGVAYESGGSVYFHVNAWPEFGKLSQIPRDQMLPIANERGNHPDDPNKRDPLDFVLWQAQAADGPSVNEPAWDSPWGPGRPGWHVECSAMAMRYLGSTIDVHSGGSDLIFPHHESEIAQSECATAQPPFVRFWMHTAMVRHEGEKMSKSLGNLVMAQDLLEDWSPDALRIYMARHHYREVWSHDPEELEQAGQLVQKLWEAVTFTRGFGELLLMDSSSAQAAFAKAMDDDLDTPLALTVLEQLADEILDAARGGRGVRAAQEALREMASVFGLRLDAEGPEKRVVAGWNRHLKDFASEAM